MTAGRSFPGRALIIMAIGKRCIIRQKSFAPVLVDAVKEGEDLNIYVMSDKLEADKEVTLLLRVMDFNGKVLTKRVSRARFRPMLPPYIIRNLMRV